jgi:hypothetical protein
VGYSVSLVTGDVTIPAGSADAALAAIRALDRRDDLKTGWSRQQLPDGTFRERPHWSFTDPDEVEAAHTLADALRAFRFEPVLSPDDDICGVALEGGTRSRGDEVHARSASTISESLKKASKSTALSGRRGRSGSSGTFQVWPRGGILSMSTG